MKRFKKFSAVTVLVLVMSIVLASCGFINGIFNRPDDPNDGPPIGSQPWSPTESTVRSMAEPSFLHGVENGISVPADMSDAIVDFYRDDERDRNVFLIDAGIVRDTFVSSIYQFHTPGIPGTEITVSRRVTSVASMTDAAIQAVTDSVTVTNFSSESYSQNVTASVTASVEIGPSFARAKVEASLETSWGGEWTNSHTNAQANERSLQTQVSRFESESQESSEQFRLTDWPAGHYRYGMYASMNIWVIVETDATNSELLVFRPITVPSTQVIIPRWSFSENGRFDNSPESGSIDFNYGFWRDLPNPSDAGFVPPPPPTPYTITFYTGGFAGGGAAVASMSAYPNSRIDLPTPVHNNPAIAFAGWRTGGRHIGTVL